MTLPVAIWSTVEGIAAGFKALDGARSSRHPTRLCAGAVRPMANAARVYERSAATRQPGLVIVIEPAGFKETTWLNTATYALSPREEEVVGFVVRGASTRQT